ncbi:pentatricopeptide repeat-containing protein At5g03800-like [Zingiber officinale]|uniref:DYW domain-containing protein n=1 Tax=Zingiber officinale TaxID=94328 RepID=A0A8J5GM35_ZINOF|nr:pentatricopeptide repeat-containing protein At5g03800-like [Zingiber officinale]XP_042391602.1 pentatricopeptide repeat-containing protein At5g03800-like [Zingiber officinale]KAG6509281.1 hypothetical protein ZIOFF_034674 [Zingiber officinale]
MAAVVPIPAFSHAAKLPSLSRSPHHHHLQFPPPHHLLRLAADRRDLALGRALHAAILKSTDNDDTRLGNALISMYLDLGRLPDARKVFALLPSPNVASFSSLISAYAKAGRPLRAAGFFFRMRMLGVEPNEFSFVAILTSCIRELNFRLGSQVHAFAVKTNHCSCVYVGNALIAVYVKCGCATAAEKLFDEMIERDASSWNTLISGMIENGRYAEAFEHFNFMQFEGHRADGFSLSTLLTAASDGLGGTEGKAIHAYAVKTGLDLNLSVGNALVSFYTQFGSIEDVADVFERMPTKDDISWTGMLNAFMEFGLVESAVQVFDQMPERNCVTYNALLAGFCHNREGSRGLEIFQLMLLNGLEISDFTLTSAMNACALVTDMKKSEQIHAFLIKSGCKLSAWIEAALLDMCSKCGRIHDAREMFTSLVHEENFQLAWTSLMCAYSRNGQHNEALSLFQLGIVRHDLMIMDEFLYSAVLALCGTLGFAEMGQQIHCVIVKSGVLSDLEVGNALFSMYAKCGNLEDSITLFSQMPQHDIVSWNTLLTAHLLHRQGDNALDAWQRMENFGVMPDGITFLLIISACRYTSSNSIETSHRLFQLMENSYSITPTSEHYSAMVDVLGYWGSFAEAEHLIQNMPLKPDTSVWRALLDSCRLRSNVSLGRQAVQSLLASEPQDPSTYVLVANLYSASGRWHCSEKVRQEMQEKGLRKIPVRSWIIHQNEVHSFYARDRSHSQSKDIYSALEILVQACMKAGYEPDTCFVLHEVEEYQKLNFLFYHSAKLAVSYGLLMARPDRPVKVVKNIHLCGDCHMFLKYVSLVTSREILVRDTSGFHHLKSGVCSCGDYW